MTLKEEPPRSVGVQYTTVEEQRNRIRMKRLSQSRNDTQFWLYMVMKVKSDAVKNNIAEKPGILCP